MVKDITMYTTTTCAYCVMVKKWLNSKGLKYNEINIDEQPERASEAFEISGQMAVPVTVITKQDETKAVVVGYNIAKLAPAVA
jgi:glutaredoxin